MILRKKYRLLLLLLALALLAVMTTAGNASAAVTAKIEITSFRQGLKSVTVKWKPVKGASSYIITRTAADRKTGKTDYRSTKKYKQKSCTFCDTGLSSTDQGKTFCYNICATDSKDNKLASATKYLVKLPTCTITDVKSSIDGKVTLSWRHYYDCVDSYRLQWGELKNGRILNVRTKDIAKEKNTITITGLQLKKDYIFYIKSLGTGLYGSKKIQNLGWPGKITVKMPDAAKLVLHYNDGSVFREILMNSGSNYTLPGMPNPKGYTFIGWGFKENVIVNEYGNYKISYEAYSEIENIHGVVNLYAILSDRSTDFFTGYLTI